MARTDMPKPTFETLKTDPLGWKLRYVEPSVILGEPAYMKGNDPADSYADANHLLWDHSVLSSIQVRKQGQNPIQVKLGDDGTWVNLSDCPYYGPVDGSGNPVEPDFPSDSIWDHWNK